MQPYRYDFSKGYQGWAPGFADFAPDSVEIYRFVHGLRERPASSGRGSSLFLSSMNRSDDVFMFHKARLAGLKPSSRYLVQFRVTLASCYVSMSGSGGDPALSVYLKGCASTSEPALQADEAGTLRLDIDIGVQASPGRNSVVLGTIEKPDDKTSDYALIERASSKRLGVVSDDLGGVWITIGTDSGYEGETQLYYTGFEVSFSEPDRTAAL